MGAAFGAVIGLGSWLALVFKGTFALIGLAEYAQIFYPLHLSGLHNLSELYI
ncbi:MAG: hypothetical protein QUS12_09365 [Methanosarcina sp.]|nr:hypothetical protein [Methanosarcina sp.]